MFETLVEQQLGVAKRNIEKFQAQKELEERVLEALNDYEMMEEKVLPETQRRLGDHHRWFPGVEM